MALCKVRANRFAIRVKPVQTVGTSANGRRYVCKGLRMSCVLAYGHDIAIDWEFEAGSSGLPWRTDMLALPRHCARILEADVVVVDFESVIALPD